VLHLFQLFTFKVRSHQRAAVTCACPKSAANDDPPPTMFIKPWLHCPNLYCSLLEGADSTLQDANQATDLGAASSCSTVWRPMSLCAKIGSIRLRRRELHHRLRVLMGEVILSAPHQQVNLAGKMKASRASTSVHSHGSGLSSSAAAGAACADRSSAPATRSGGRAEAHSNSKRLQCVGWLSTCKACPEIMKRRLRLGASLPSPSTPRAHTCQQ
jgi:hypothetical protein